MPRAEHRAIAGYAAERGVEVIAVGTDLYGIAPSADAAAALGLTLRRRRRARQRQPRGRAREARCPPDGRLTHR